MIWNSTAKIPSPPLSLFIVMLPKVHLTSHSRMSGCRWIIISLWLSRSLRPFLYSSCVYSCHLFLISSASIKSSLFSLYHAHPCMKCLFAISNFLEEISSLSHSIAFLYFLALFIKEGFLISPCYSLELCIRLGLFFPFSLFFFLLFFLQVSVKPPQTITFPSCISFSLGWFWSLPTIQRHEPLSIVIQVLSNTSNLLNLFITSTV